MDSSRLTAEEIETAFLMWWFDINPAVAPLPQAVATHVDFAIFMQDLEALLGEYRVNNNEAT